ncbi:hypothetical protein BDQ17DRAFT_178966 [Cyathus striatus]|nr:hypothetical protein BDQ17DRAFT_178966 [Cyathus striatus]
MTIRICGALSQRIGMEYLWLIFREQILVLCLGHWREVEDINGSCVVTLSSDPYILTYSSSSDLEDISIPTNEETKSSGTPFCVIA